MLFDVKLTVEAESQLLDGDLWWRENRDKAPELFTEEYAAVVRLLKVAPAAGQPYTFSPVVGTRRVLMRKTRFHVYYVHRVDRSDVVILAVWSAVRGYGPPIPQPPP